MLWTAVQMLVIINSSQYKATKPLSQAKKKKFFSDLLEGPVSLKNFYKGLSLPCCQAIQLVQVTGETDRVTETCIEHISTEIIF